MGYKEYMITSRFVTVPLRCIALATPLCLILACSHLSRPVADGEESPTLLAGEPFLSERYQKKVA